MHFDEKPTIHIGYVMELHRNDPGTRGVLVWIPGEAVPFRRTYGKDWHGDSHCLPVGKVRRHLV